MFNKISLLFTEKVAFRLLSFSAAVYVLVLYSWCCLKYYGFAYDDFDLAIHDQIMWNILHGRIFNSILGVDFLGNHVHFISFLAAPFYYFIPHPLFLLFLQTVFLAAGVFPLYGLARVYLGPLMSLTIGVIYLLYPGLGFTNLYEFHPTCFAPFFLLCAAYYFYKEGFFLFSIFMALSLLCQENIALIFIMWGIYAFCLKRKLQWVVWPIGLGLLYFLFCVYVILPGFNKNTFNFFDIYGPLGGSLGQVARTCFRHPAHVLALIFQPRKIYYLAALFISVAFVPLLSPLALLPAFLIFVQHLLSFRLSEVDLHYHYTAELIPFIFVAFIFGVKKIIGFRVPGKYLSLTLLLSALIVNWAFGPLFVFRQEWKRLPSCYSITQKEALIKQIPKDASVVATFKFLPHLSHRQDLYSFHHVYSGFYTMRTRPYHLPGNVEYALIDFNDPRTFLNFYTSSSYRNIDDFLQRGAWGTMDVQDSMVLFRRNTKDKYPLFNVINDHMAPPHPLHCIVDDRIELYGYDIHMLSDRIDLVFYWKLLRDEQKDVNMFIEFIGPQGSILDIQNRPLCYGIWPTQAWQKNRDIEEHQYISIAPGLKGSLQGFRVGFYDHYTGRVIHTDTKDVVCSIDFKLTD